MMKRLLPILLCLVVLVHWAGEIQRCFQVTYELKEQHRMNALEWEIAGRMEKSLQDLFVVQVIREMETELRGNYYHNFLFSEKIHNDTLRFLLLEKTGNQTLETRAQASGDSPAQSPVPGQRSLDDLFVKYLASGKLEALAHQPLPNRLISSEAASFTTRSLPVPTPPPKSSASFRLYLQPKISV